MDETSRLISELHQKLSELDQKVSLYRQDMTAEYTKYADGLLRNVPEHISSNVRKAIAETLKSFPALAIEQPVSAALKADTEVVPAVVAPKAINAIQTPLPIPAMAKQSADSQADVPRSPHARDKEFTGLFTPSYLPLLDSTDRHERRSSGDNRALPGLSVTQTAAIAIERPPERTDTSLSTSSSYTPASPLPKPPTPKRRNTDEASIASNGDSPKRRSALRRMSSASKSQSPRRVRFDFEGEHFATTSSPVSPTTVSASVEETPMVPSLLDSDDEAGSEQVEDITVPIPPKRVSSTQALRNLSRGPIEDDGTKWTEVSAPPDGSASINGPPQDEDSEEEFLDMGARKKSPANGAAVVIPANGQHVQEDMSAEEQDILSEMTPLQAMHSTKSFFTNSALPSSAGSSSPLDESQTSATNNPTLNLLTQVLNASKANENEKPAQKEDYLDGDDNDHLFDFDDAPQSTDRPKFHLEDDSSHSSEGEDEVPSLSTSPVVTANSNSFAKYATSPARAIVHPKTHPAYSAHDSEPPKAGSIGANLNESSNGVGMGTSLSNSMRMNHPFSVPVVTPAVHEMAKRMGPMNSMVGSLNGNSGLDESTASFDNTYGGGGSVMGGGGSFRGGSLRNGGQPRSFSERLRLEEFMNERHGGD